MKKKFFLITFIGFISIFLTGCWNYVGLNEMTIVAGIAVDKLDDRYLLSIEIYNLQKSSSDNPVKPAIVETTGETIFEAVRNAKRRISNKLYFADAKIIILSDQIARENGIREILNWFQKDPEIRENLEIVISQEKDAVTLLKTSGLTNLVISNDIQNIVEKDQKVTGTTESSELYKIFDTLNSKGISLTLPAMRQVENDGKKVVELNGIAIFKADKLVDYLTADETKYYLIAKGKLKGGIIAFDSVLGNSKDKKETISLEIKKCTASQDYKSLTPDNLKINIAVSMDVSIGELVNQQSTLTEKDLELIQNEANQFIEKKISSVIEKIQQNYNTDILGLENILYRKNNKTWKKMQGSFRDEFQKIKINVSSDVKIINTGFTK